jgi:hypothetical protein
MTVFGKEKTAAGQAAIELMVAVLLLLLVITGLMHIEKLTRSSLFLHAVLRANAGEAAMADAALADTPDPIRDWDKGADKTAYTADDKAQKSGTAFPATVSMLTAYSTEGHRDDDWQYVSDSILPSSMVRLRESGGVGTLLGAVHAEETLDVPVEPVIRDLAYGKDEVRVKEEVWMPLMGGLY